MTQADHKEKLTALEEEILRLEEQAGVRTQADRAREGPLIPHGVLDETAAIGTPEREREATAYFDHEHDYRRRHIRRIYFGVKDAALRRRLIRLQRERDCMVTEQDTKQLRQAKQELAEAKSKADRAPFGKAAIVAGVTTALGYYAFDLAGAIGGAVVGFFLAQWTLHDARAFATGEVAAAEEFLAWLKGEQGEEASRPEFFNAQEEASGEEDENFSRVSAFRNRATAEE